MFSTSCIFFFKHETAYEMRISDWSSDVCSSDLNQYVNSAALGPWEDILIGEVVPLVEGRFGCGGAGRRGVFGKSSGGYGSILHALKHADFWAAAACHSGDKIGRESCRESLCQDV